MELEYNIFKKYELVEDNLLKYGFKLSNNKYQYKKDILDNTFRVEIDITKSKEVSGKVIDLSFDEEEYLSFRIENNQGSFANKVKEEYEKILYDIRDNCYKSKLFVYNQSNRIIKEIKDKYGDEPEFEWESSPNNAIFRNKKSNKWYCLILTVKKNRLGYSDEQEVEVMNMKLDPNRITELLKREGFYKAYHMNKKSWITIILDETITDTEIMELLSESYSYTVTNDSSDWLIPANPNYFDIEKALEDKDEIIWKQTSKIKALDIVYLYIGSPISSIKYKFKVLSSDIPYQFANKNLKINKVMNLKLLERYDDNKYSFSKLNEFGVNAIRGPRHIPEKLKDYIERGDNNGNNSN